jgi:hypothetical protein
MIENNVQEKLVNIKQKVIAQPARYEFSSYLEYFCGTEIGHFTDIEIDRAAERFIPTLERILTTGNLAQELKQSRLPSELFKLNKGAAILGSCYVTEQFLNDLRILPDRHYWAIWFCLEVLEHLAVNNITSINSFINISKSGQQLFHVPTGHFLSFLTTPVITSESSKTHVVELLEAKMESVQNE